MIEYESEAGPVHMMTDAVVTTVCNRNIAAGSQVAAFVFSFRVGIFKPTAPALPNHRQDFTVYSEQPTINSNRLFSKAVRLIQIKSV